MNFIRIIILLFFIPQAISAQTIELRPLEMEKDYSTTRFVVHKVQGKVKSVTIKTFSYNNIEQDYKEDFSVLPDFYRPSIFFIDSLGQIEKRILFRETIETKKLEKYSRKKKDSDDYELFIQRYSRIYKGNIPDTNEIDFSLKEIYQNNVLIHRFLYQYIYDYNYDSHGNLLNIVRSEYENPHSYNKNNNLNNLTGNTLKSSKILFSYAYDDKNRCIEKKEINTEYITYITKYVYNEHNLLEKELQLSYTDKVLDYVSIYTYQYDENGNLTDQKEYNKQTFNNGSKTLDEKNFVDIFLAQIKKDTDSYLKEHTAYTYEYDNNGNWIVKNFKKFGAQESWVSNSKIGWINMYRIERVIEYY